MGVPHLYHWDFDRNPWDSRSEAMTFSVGVYQWLPKASGKGLKKSNTIRVQGYVADSQSVYDKAMQLCERLNAEKVRWGELPEWVQKSYSVPKPSDLIVKRLSPGLSGAQVRVVRNHVVKEHLLPVGLIQSHSSTYVKRVDEIIQLINFQTAPWGERFTVNLGLHYIFTPPHGQLRRMKWSSLDHLDCSLERRIGFFLPQKLDTWFEFGDDSDALRGRFIYSVEQSIRVLEEYTAKLNEMMHVLANSAPPGRASHRR